MDVFFTDNDHRAYLAMLRESCMRHGITVWAYCLMRNHVHIIAVPSTPSALAQCFSEAHVRYSRRINRREDWKGHLWQARFGSSVMDERYLLAAVRYVERNPVEARIVARPWDYPWSSARWHMGMVRTDPVIRDDERLRTLVSDWRSYLDMHSCEAETRRIEQDVPVNRPLGEEKFIAELQEQFGQALVRRRAGRPTGSLGKKRALAPKNKLVAVPN